MIFDLETIYNNSLSSIASAAITEIQHYYKNVCLFINIVKCLWKSTHFAIIYSAYEELTPFYNNVSGPK